ncbi:unnamed protein product [Acanthoscelides obtectus]|uniref:Uncharacterized protein n=1 Tax=Acanthoscelides obtectus TaxID=200917 RepID=A0A9P0P6W6_ACAOB|nr:unnamed protein product [Acanthoscelides obtectus]CAK1631762.1 hypothetical protein AOBTE_LOCUS7140 [Acanthoscelides obtectus]
MKRGTDWREAKKLALSKKMDYIHVQIIMVMILGICPNLQSRDYCEAGRNMTVKNFGRLFTDKSSVWYNILQFKPPVTFPLKPGLYEALNDPTKSVYPVVQRTSWLLKILMYYEDEVLLCNICEGEMFE